MFQEIFMISELNSIYNFEVSTVQDDLHNCEFPYYKIWIVSYHTVLQYTVQYCTVQKASLLSEALFLFKYPYYCDMIQVQGLDGNSSIVSLLKSNLIQPFE